MVRYKYLTLRLGSKENWPGEGMDFKEPLFLCENSFAPCGQMLFVLDFL